VLAKPDVSYVHPHRPPPSHPTRPHRLSNSIAPYALIIVNMKSAELYILTLSEGMSAENYDILNQMREEVDHLPTPPPQ
jgi:hypothetical protein